MVDTQQPEWEPDLPPQHPPAHESLAKIRDRLSREERHQLSFRFDEGIWRISARFGGNFGYEFDLEGSDLDEITYNLLDAFDRVAP